MDARFADFVHSLYFEMQSVEGVRPLEIWNGVREMFDPFEKASLVKNLCKIVVPLVNEHCQGLAFPAHSDHVLAGVQSLLDWLAAAPDSRVLARFPYPPVGDGDQKELYRLVKQRATIIVRRAAEEAREAARGSAARGGASRGAAARAGRELSADVFPNGLFDFREMRLVDNELPYIIFTDKEFRVIHGLAIVYLWLIDMDGVFLRLLEQNGVGDGIPAEYRQFTRRVHRENPLTVRGRRMGADELVAMIQEKMRDDDYLDVFENVYTWFEQAKKKLSPS
jgi:hypothetical protein